MIEFPKRMMQFFPEVNGGRTDPNHALIAPLVTRRVDVRRARIVSEPISDYIRFEHDVTPVANLAAGEQVRWLPRRHASDLALPGNDFWLVDDCVWWNHFSGDGEWTGGELTTEPAVVSLCGSAFDDGWQREQLRLNLTEIKASLSHHADQAWIYGIDQSHRVRLVLVRSEPYDSPAGLA